MLDKNLLRARAKEQFVALMRDKVSWISEECYPGNLEGRFREINQFVGAAKTFGVTDAQSFTAEEIETIVKDLAPLRTLEMKSEARQILVNTLREKGFESEILEPKLEK